MFFIFRPDDTPWDGGELILPFLHVFLQRFLGLFMMVYFVVFSFMLLHTLHQEILLLAICGIYVCEFYLDSFYFFA